MSYMDTVLHKLVLPENSADLPAVWAVEDNGLPPLLLVHGFLSSRVQWYRNLDALTQFSRPITVELFGHGGSPSPVDDAAYSIERYFDVFSTICQFAGVSKINACGHSFGAGILTRFALDRHDLVDRLVITNSSTSFQSQQQKMRPAAKQAMINSIEERGIDALNALPQHPRHMKRVPEAYLADVARMSDRIDPLGVVNTLKVTLDDLSIHDRVSEYSTETLLLNGIYEKPFQPFIEWIESNLPTFTVENIEGGHSLNAECPDAFNAAVATFLDR